MEKSVNFNADVSAVVVLYNPDLSNLKKSLLSLITQVGNVILIDNSPINLETGEFLSFFKDFSIEYYFLGENLGIAKAQNIGIHKALNKKSNFVLIMDQDSIPFSDMVYHLKHDFIFLSNKGCKVGAIGPVPINIQTQAPYSSRIKKNYPFFDDCQNIIKVSELISSGSLIDLAIFEDVGLMDESLFIDGVDHEWCWRANSKGYVCAMSNNAKLQHMLGEGDRKIFGIRIAITSPFRVFYQFRNYFYLCKRQYVPLYWKINNGFKYLIKILYYPTFVSPRKLYLKNILRGIKAGLSVKG
ncbi:glycosyltransferase family 2 protein [Flavobacterium sp. LC2016-01]|uniref:glycosyltransferase family 2 protein n=1 Tax=Flavobacterium sp. LC2016-01 TaxID=2675876 RepID=UPI0012BAEB72|nr:glycosyltransferase family 2 protein [Flavobacterium sp. LC2016-01]MTH17512.1 glycosyltransferase [Flavobacterium sp. LC2016-01]